MSFNATYVKEKLNAIKNTKAEIANVIRSKYVEVSESAKLDEYGDYVNKIEDYDLNKHMLVYDNYNQLIRIIKSSDGNYSSAMAGYAGVINDIKVGNNVINLSYAFRNSYNYRTNPINNPSIVNMYGTYQGCNRITGNAFCGPNVTDMSRA